jgi:hypothetical protein
MMETQQVQAKESAAQSPFTSSPAPAVQMSEPAGAAQAAGGDLTGGQSPSPQATAPVMAHWTEGGAVQGKGQSKDTGEIHKSAAQGISGGGESLPFGDQLQRAFGKHDLSGVRAHTGSAAASSTQQMGADAYATGNNVVFGKTPDLHTAAHEAAHVVQQRGGVQLKDGVGKSDDKYERNADAVADRVVQGKSAEDLLDPVAGHARTPALQKKPKKGVSGKGGKRLGQAQDAIKHTKGVLNFGAGNQYEALKATNFNSYFRMEVMRDMSYWELEDSVRPLAAANPEALTAAMADLAHGGNCGEHAQIAFDYLRAHAKGETINMSDVEGLDHAFVIIGNVSGESDADLCVSDPWPSAPTACLWEDHFAFTADRTKINRRHTAVADGQNVKAVIARGLRLTPEGQARIKAKLTNEQTEAELKKGTDRSSGHPWIWRHPGTTAAGHDYDYQVTGGGTGGATSSSSGPTR